MNLLKRYIAEPGLLIPDVQWSWRSSSLGTRIWLLVFLTLDVSLFFYGLALFFFLPSDSNYLNVLSLALAFGQVMTGFLGLVLTIGLGYFVVHEYIQNRAAPSLLLGLRKSDGQLAGEAIAISLEIDEDFSQPETNDWSALVIENRGAVIATHFMIEFHAPFLRRYIDDWISNDRGTHPDIALRTFVEGGKALGLLSEPLGTLERHWKVFWDESAFELVYRFSSQGDTPAYPDWPLTLCKFVHYWDDVYSGTYKCKYVIIGEHTKPVRGNLELRIDVVSVQSIIQPKKR